MIYHGYENGFRTLGRQTLLEPMEWTADGWFRAKGGDLSRPIAKPTGGQGGPAGFPLSDDFSTNRFGIQWSFHDPAPDEMERVRYVSGGLEIAGRGKSPIDSAPLVFTVPDRSYEAEVTIDLEDGAEGGLLLFYSHKAFVGVGFDGARAKTFEFSEEQPWMRPPFEAKSIRARVTNDDNIVTFQYSKDGAVSWTQHPLRMEVSGYHHNVFGGFLSLKVGIYAAGRGRIRLRDFHYHAIRTR
jgi:xylan 1,4-beta-xylosidase